MCPAFLRWPRIVCGIGDLWSGLAAGWASRGGEEKGGREVQRSRGKTCCCDSLGLCALRPSIIPFKTQLLFLAVGSALGALLQAAGQRAPLPVLQALAGHGPALVRSLEAEITDRQGRERQAGWAWVAVGLPAASSRHQLCGPACLPACPTLQLRPASPNSRSKIPVSVQQLQQVLRGLTNHQSRPVDSEQRNRRR